MQLKMPSGIIAEGTPEECRELLNGEKKEIQSYGSPIKVRVKKYKHKSSYRRQPWSGKELATIRETINLPVRFAMKQIPNRTSTSLWNVRGLMKKNALPPKLQAKMNAYLNLMN